MIKEFGSRLQVVGFLPTLLAVGCLALLVIMGAPSEPLTWESLGDAIDALGVGGAAAITGAAVAVSITLQPLQFRLVQILEGYWPTGHGAFVFHAGVALQRWRYERLLDRLVSDNLPKTEAGRRVVQERMLAAESRLRTRFPREDRLLPTTLGNVLRSAEDRVGARYGIEAVTLWPRLYPLLPADFRATLEDEVTQLDVSARLAVTWGATATVVSGMFLADLEGLSSNPAWLMIVLALWALSLFSYKSAIESAIAHGGDLEVALDLHRALVITAMRLTLPDRLSEETRIFKRLCRLYSTYTANHGQEFRFRREPAIGRHPTVPAED